MTGSAAAAPRERARGFTLIELVTVMALVSILLAVALPNYKNAILQAKEATLREDLFRMRDLIDQYYVDKGKYPASLAALVEEKYLRRIPVDPITNQADWVEVPAEPDPDNPGEPPGIMDVRSASEGASTSGTPYSEW